MDHIGNYREVTFPLSRLSTIDTCEIGRKKHAMQAMIEIDVTEARKKIRENKKSGRDISFTSWLIHCIAGVCAEHPEIHAMRHGRHGAVVFDDVDISVIVEREVQGQKVPLPVVLRKANEKSIEELCQEIRQAQKQTIGNEGDYVLGGGPKASLMKLYYALPGFLRRFFLRRIVKNPMRAKKYMGTVAVTSLGMAGRFNGYFVPISIHPLTFAIGSIIKKPELNGDTIVPREYLFVTVLIDHDTVDGAPAARALSKLIERMEKGYGL